jgi:hypothetical protein
MFNINLLKMDWHQPKIGLLELKIKPAEKRI